MLLTDLACHCPMRSVCAAVGRIENEGLVVPLGRQKPCSALLDANQCRKSALDPSRCALFNEAF